jgi:hypothetical protein
MNAFGGSLFALPLQAPDSQLQVSVGFADNSSPSANFPEPWSETNPLVNFVGSGIVYRAGAIRLDNPGSLPVTVDSVKVGSWPAGPRPEDRRRESVRDGMRKSSGAASSQPIACNPRGTTR